ncbi:MAG: hypothetical protein MJA28_05880 [Gammaproteobacteria bacterium]|mgnify:CR=1 FL=1|nr:hypothetical protein [Gammaproteobacteria bacterium]MCP4234505.1 hypothetical protein [Aestuariibacter sp.]MCP5017428.1 hypothetical protein [Ketobacter sp.]
MFDISNSCVVSSKNVYRECFMDLKSLKVLFSDGGLTAAVAVKAPFEQKGWLLHFQRRNGGVAVIGTVREPEAGKVFRSLDAVASAAADVGFSQVLVKLTEREEIDPDDFELKAQ